MQMQYCNKPQLINLSQQQDLRAHESLREFVHRAGRIPPGVSKLPPNHQLAKMRATKRQAIHRAAEHKANAYKRAMS